MIDSQKRGLALLATLVALMLGAKDWIADVWGGLGEVQRAFIVTVAAWVIVWLVLWPLARWLWPFFF